MTVTSRVAPTASRSVLVLEKNASLGGSAGTYKSGPLVVEASLHELEAQGVVLRGAFTPGMREREWCERRLLARIHRYTLNRLRAEIEPVVTAFGQYKLAPDGGHEPWSLQVLEISGGRIAGITFFLDTASLFPLFGLPPRLEA